MLQRKLGKRIAELRRSRGLTQVQLAQKLGCSVEFMSLVERGVNGPTVAGLEKLAKMLKVDVVELFTFERRPSAGASRPDESRSADTSG